MTVSSTAIAAPGRFAVGPVRAFALGSGACPNKVVHRDPVRPAGRYQQRTRQQVARGSGEVVVVVVHGVLWGCVRVVAGNF